MKFLSVCVKIERFMVNGVCLGVCLYAAALKVIGDLFHSMSLENCSYN